MNFTKGCPVSKLEDKFAQQLVAEEIFFTQQDQCIPGRRFKADFLIKRADGKQLCVEIDGGLYVGYNNRSKFGNQSMGRHQSIAGRKADGDRDCIFLINDIVTLRITDEQMKNGQAVAAIRAWMERTG